MHTLLAVCVVITLLYIECPAASGLEQANEVRSISAEPSDLIGKRVFLVKAAVGWWKKIVKGSLGRVTEEVVSEGDGAAVAVQVRGLLIEAPLRVLQVVPDAVVGDRVEVHFETEPGEVSTTLRGPAVVSAVLQGGYVMLCFEGLFYEQVFADFLVPECFGRGVRTIEGPTNDHHQRSCVCDPPYTGHSCLATLRPTPPPSLFSGVMSSLFPAFRKYSPKEETIPETKLAALTWQGMTYPTISHVKMADFRHVVSLSVYTLVVGCRVWDSVCDVALDTVSRVSINGTHAPVKHRYDEDSCTATPTKDTQLQRVWMDASELAEVGVSVGPAILLYSKYTTTLVAQFEGLLSDAEGVSQLLAAVATPTQELQTQADVETFLSTSEIAIFFDSSKIPRSVVRSAALRAGATHAEAPWQLHSPSSSCWMTVYIRRDAKEHHRVEYSKQTASADVVAAWVALRAVPLVRRMTSLNYEAIIHLAKAARSAVIITASSTPSEEIRSAALQAKFIGTGSVTFYTADTTRRAEFLRRYGHARYICVLPHIPEVRYTSTAPITMADVEAASLEPSSHATEMHQATLPSPGVYDGRVLSLSQVSVRQIAEMCEVDVACCHRGSCVGCAGEKVRWERMLLVVRTTWCWHCALVVPAVAHVAERLAQGKPDADERSDTLIAELIADDILTLPTWLGRVTSYPAVFLVKRTHPTTCDVSTLNVTQYKGTNYHAQDLLLFIQRWREGVQQTPKRQRNTRLRKRARDMVPAEHRA